METDGLYWERDNVHWPGRLSRWCAEIMVERYAQGVKELAAEHGWLIDGIAIREVDNCVYYAVVPVGGKARKAPPNFLVPLLLRLVPEMRRRVARLREDNATGYWEKAIDAWFAAREQELLDHADRLLTVDLGALDDRSLADLARQAVDHAGACMKEHFHCHGAGIAVISTLGRELTAEHGFTTAEFAGLLTGLSNATTGPAASQQAIVEAVVAAGGSDRLRVAADLDQVRAIDETVAKALDDYLATWGRRAIRYQVAYPTIAERPDWVLAALKAQLDRSEDAGQRERAHAATRAAAEARVRAALGDTPETRRRIALAQKAAPLREGNETVTVALPVAAVRRIGLEVGRRLVEKGLLDEPDHVFDLETGEALATLTDGPGRPADPAAVARARNADRTSDRPEPSKTFGQPIAPPDLTAFPKDVADTMGALLWLVQKAGVSEGGEDGDAAAVSARVVTGDAEGTGASPGTYEGRVRVILGEHEFDKLQDGDVLVCPITSPIWSMLFPQVGALVCDAGGPMSHPAIIAREFGIPAVVGTERATTIFRDGERVLVDGDNGVVTRVVA
ncbi:MAG: rifampicin phosphotransferase [Actinomycetota bacterium]|jgi:pyruvate,water dikinase